MTYYQQEIKRLKQELRDQKAKNEILDRINKLMIIQAGPLFKAYMDAQYSEPQQGYIYASVMKWAVKHLGLEPLAMGDKIKDKHYIQSMEYIGCNNMEDLFE